MHPKTFNAEYIRQQIPENLRHYFLVQSAELTEHAEPVINALIEAISLVSEVLAIPKRIIITIDASPFIINGSSGVFTYDAIEDSKCSYMQDLVFIDINKIGVYSYPIQVTCILEELVHTQLNIRDEILVKYVVAKLYNGVKFDGECFTENV